MGDERPNEITIKPNYCIVGILILAIAFLSFTGYAQNPLRFHGEVDAIRNKYDTVWDSSKATIVFTGSSSIRMWADLQHRFPEHQIVNTGFGGSQASDLLAYSNELILRFNPKKVFIYEGDNDIAEKKRTNRIVTQLQKLIETIKEHNQDVRIVLIAAKPSLARWTLRHRYKRLNRRMEQLALDNPTVEFANVWDAMLIDRKLIPDIFLADGLHMNAKGYDLWYSVLKNHLK